MTTRVCKYCGGNIDHLRITANMCESRVCLNAYKREYARTKKDVKYCVVCEKPITEKGNGRSRGKYCSDNCYQISRSSAYRRKVMAKPVVIDPKVKAANLARVTKFLAKVDFEQKDCEFNQAVYEAQEKKRRGFNGKRCRVCKKKLKGTEWFFCREHFIAATGLATTSRTDGAYNEASEGGRVFGGQGRE